MRKGVAILFVLVMMLSGVHVTIATHFCDGKVADTKVSLFGKLASCGMENTTEKFPFQRDFLASHCCDNQVTIIGIVNNFTPPVSIFTENTQNFQNIYYLPVSQLFDSNTISKYFYTSISPPGRFAFSSVSLDDICVFRI
jgi:hypothetical protein